MVLLLFLLFLQTCFVSIDDLLEAFDKFLESPTLEYKIWLKIALDVAVKTFKENLPGQVSLRTHACVLCMCLHVYTQMNAIWSCFNK